MSTQKTRERLIAVLTGLANFSSDAEATVAFRQAFTDHGSETPDNSESVQKIEVGTAENPFISGMQERGLRLHSRGWLLSELLWVAEGSTIPSKVRREFPGITQEEWDAVGRIVTMVFSLLDEEPNHALQPTARAGSVPLELGPHSRPGGG